MKFEIAADQRCPGCYGAGSVVLDGHVKAAFVSEEEGTGGIDLVDLESFSVLPVVKGPGGGMNLVPLPKQNGEFLCIQKFYPVFRSEDAVVVWGYRENGHYVTKEVQPLPFVHRIEVVSLGSQDYLMCASLCKTKKFTEDWSYPGSVYVGKIDYAAREIQGFHEIYTGIFQNHGLTRLGSGREGVLIAGQNGVHRLVPPASENGQWSVEALIDEPTSDCVAADLDGDGVWELGTIAPFHGAEFHIWKRIDGRYQKVYTLPGSHAFGHAIWGGTFNGIPSFLVGYRAGGMELLLLEWRDGAFVETLVDAGAGPANVTILPGATGDLICAANRQTDRWTIYRAVT